MVSITLSIPEDIKHKMNRFSEINWSGFIRNKIIEKTSELSWRENMLKKFKGEKEKGEFALELQRKARKGRAKKLKKLGLIR